MAGLSGDEYAKLRSAIAAMAPAVASVADAARTLYRNRSAAEERVIRDLLGRWVSEFEPSIAMRDGEIIGLCVAGDPSGSIPVRVALPAPVVPLAFAVPNHG